MYGRKLIPSTKQIVTLTQLLLGQFGNMFRLESKLITFSIHHLFIMLQYDGGLLKGLKESMKPY